MTVTKPAPKCRRVSPGLVDRVHLKSKGAAGPGEYGEAWCGRQQRVPGQEWALGTRCHLWSTLQSPRAPEFMGFLTNCLPTRNPGPKTEG